MFTLIGNVALQSVAPTEEEFYRFHTGTAEYRSIAGRGLEGNVAWKGTSIRILINQSISVEQVDWLHATRTPYHQQVST